MFPWRFLLPLLLAFSWAAPGHAQQQMLQNRSFETTSRPTTDGNNFFDSIQPWTTHNVNPSQVQPVNIIRPFVGYLGGPPTVAPGDTGGVNYFDVNSASGVVRQTIILPSPGTVTIGGWFSTRDGVRTLSGMQIKLRNAALTTDIVTTSVSFTTADEAFTWKEAPSVTTAVLPAGSYVFEIIMPNEANFDLASAIYVPQLSVSKSGVAYNDPVNGTTNPKQIPGGVTEYSIIGSTRPGVTASNVVIADTTPARTDLVVANLGGFTGPAAFAPGSTGLTYSFTSLGSTTDRIDFSSDNGLTWTYTPVANANGVDPAVTNVRVRPLGTMAANTSWTLRLRYRVE